MLSLDFYSTEHLNVTYFGGVALRLWFCENLKCFIGTYKLPHTTGKFSSK